MSRDKVFEAMNKAKRLSKNKKKKKATSTSKGSGGKKKTDGGFLGYAMDRSRGDSRSGNPLDPRKW